MTAFTENSPSMNGGSLGIGTEHRLQLLDFDGTSNGDLYEFLIWTFAGFLILLIVIMWGCYYWASYRLRQAESRRKQDSRRRRGNRDESHNMPSTLQNDDFSSVGSRPKIIMVPTGELMFSDGRGGLHRLPGGGDSSDDGSRGHNTTSGHSMGSLATYMNAMRTAAARLRANEPIIRRVSTAPASSAPARRRFDFDSMGDDLSFQPDSIPGVSYGEFGASDSEMDEEAPAEANNKAVETSAVSVKSEDMSLYM